MIVVNTHGSFASHVLALAGLQMVTACVSKWSGTGTIGGGQEQMSKMDKGCAAQKSQWCKIRTDLNISTSTQVCLQPVHTLCPQITHCTTRLHIAPPNYTLCPQITPCAPRLHIVPPELHTVPPDYTLCPQITHSAQLASHQLSPCVRRTTPGRGDY